MSVWANIKGIVSTLLQIGGPSGGQIKHIPFGASPAHLQARDSTDAAFMEFKVATPTMNESAVTKAYADGLVGGASSLKVITIPISGAAGNYDSAFAAAVGGKVMRVEIRVDVSFDGAATLAVKQASGAGTFMTTAENDPTTLGLYTIDLAGFVSVVADVFRVTVGGTPTAGSAVAYIYYVPTPEV